MEVGRAAQRATRLVAGARPLPRLTRGRIVEASEHAGHHHHAGYRYLFGLGQPSPRQQRLVRTFLGTLAFAPCIPWPSSTSL